MLRRMLVGLTGAVVICGAVAAKPPGLQPDPQVEGRELDPVTRDHFLPEPPAVTNVARERSALGSADRDAFWALVLGAHEAVTNEFTMPLGTARLAGM